MSEMFIPLYLARCFFVWNSWLFCFFAFVLIWFFSRFALTLTFLETGIATGIEIAVDY